MSFFTDFRPFFIHKGAMDKEAQFYLIYPLGLTEFGLLELKEKWELHFKNSFLNIIAVDDGGILISTSVLHGFLLNHLLRSPTRILLRVAEFKARDFPKLFGKISKIPWKSLMLGQSPEVIASATNSRLFDSRKIEKAIQDGILESYRKQPVKKKYLDYLEQNKNNLLPKIYYRAVDDVITISLDTTGELLHKRGEKIFTGLAPIRENLATLLLLSLTNNLPDKKYTLIDPMSGSGTFLIEAYDHYAANNSRSFSYQHIPLWIDETQKKTYLENLSSKENPHFGKYMGLEINPEVIALAKKNAGTKTILFHEGDIFKEAPLLEGDNLVIINPPYGLRVGEKSDINLEYYKKIIEMVKKKYAPERMGIIIPEEYRYQPKSDELLFKLPFKNGGLPVVFYVLKTK